MMESKAAGTQYDDKGVYIYKGAARARVVHKVRVMHVACVMCGCMAHGAWCMKGGGESISLMSFMWEVGRLT